MLVPCWSFDGKETPVALLAADDGDGDTAARESSSLTEDWSAISETQLGVRSCPARTGLAQSWRVGAGLPVGQMLPW